MEPSTYLAEGRKRRFGGRRRGCGGVREASRHGRGHHRLLAGPAGEGVHEVGAPPAGILRGRGCSKEERERRDSGAGRHHAGPGQELARRRSMLRGGVVRHCGGCSRRRSGRDGGAGSWNCGVEGRADSDVGEEVPVPFAVACLGVGPSGRQRRWVRIDGVALGATWSVYSVAKIFQLTNLFLL